MNYKKHTLPNGLRVIITPFKNLESVTVTVWAGVGSRHESEHVSGISHFLEHMVFKGSKKRPTAREISEAVDAIGGEFNAGTSKDYTNFYIKSRAEVVETAMDVLSDMVLRPFLRAEDLERERGVILEEISMYEDTPTAHIGDIFENLIFKGHSLGRDIIGTRKTVKSVTRDDFENHRKEFYYAENMLVTIAGGVTESDALRLTTKYFGKLKGKKNAIDITPYTEQQKKPQILLDSQKKEQAHFILGFRSFEKTHPDRQVQSVLASILGGGMSSRLFTEIREKRGLAYSVRTSTENFIDTGYLETYAGVDPKNAVKAAEIVIEQLYGFRDGKYPLQKGELTKAKEYLKGHLALSLEDTRSINHFFGEEELIAGRIRTAEEVYKRVDAVTEEDLLRVAKEIIKPEGLNLAIIGPFESDAKFKRIVA
jgi:predicted Zn-dependent peptidase